MKYFTLTIVIAALFSINAMPQNGTKKISFEDVVTGYSFYGSSIHGLKSMNDGIHYTTIKQGKYLVKYAYRTGEVVDTLFNVDDLENQDIGRIGSYEFNHDETAIIFPVNQNQIYRHSFTADYYIYDFTSGSLTLLSDNGPQQLATFSPDGGKVAFVRENNMFITYLEDKIEVQITSDGKRNTIINGAPDWVYEEEFGFSKAFEWSPDGKKVAYIRFDESDVKEFSMTMFAGQAPELTENVLYPETRTWKYPKAGDDNSLVSVNVYHTDTEETILMDVGDEVDQYIPRIKWTNDPEWLFIYRVNRLQNKLEFLKAEASTGKTTVVYTDENKYFILEENLDRLTFLDDGEHFIYLNEKDGWNHIYLYGINGNEINQVTSGEFDVTGFYGVDEGNGFVYYQAAKISPLQREVYRIKMDGSGETKLSSKEGTNRAQFNNDFSYFINYFSNATTPNYITLNTNKGKEVRVLEDNSELKEKLTEYKFNFKEFFSFTTSEGVELNGYIIKPPDFDPSKKYPVFMTQYSGPNSQSVRDSWGLGWMDYMAAEGYVIACVDGRGTGARGEEFRKMTYLQLGKYETIDQIEAAKYLGSLLFTDPDRIGIWGWSYGGFMTLLCMTKGEGTFKAGIAVAPVTSWRYYDNIYTERFMRKPQENADGYDDNAPMSFADQLEGSLLIVHGSADDNVHVQNTMEFTEKLVQADKDFDMMIYTNRNHGIYGGNTRNHLFRKMTRFILEEL